MSRNCNSPKNFTGPSSEVRTELPSKIHLPQAIRHAWLSLRVLLSITEFFKRQRADRSKNGRKEKLITPECLILFCGMLRKKFNQTGLV